MGMFTSSGTQACRRSSVAFCVPAVILLAAATARADSLATISLSDEPDSPAQPTASASSPQRPQLPDYIATVDLTATVMLPAGLDNSPAEYAASKAGFEFNVIKPYADGSAFGVGLSSAATFYSFTDAQTLLGGGDPWGTVGTHGIQAFYSAPIRDGWSYLVGAKVQSSGELGADLGDTLTYGGLVGFKYKVSESLDLGLAVAVSTRLEDSTLFVPVPTITWKIDDQWSLGSGGESGGGGLSLRYSPNQQWTYSLRAGYESERFRLDDEGPNPGGIGEESSVPISLGATWNYDQQGSAFVRVIVPAWRQLRADDPNGNTIFEHDADITPSFQFGIEGRF